MSPKKAEETQLEQMSPQDLMAMIIAQQQQTAALTAKMGEMAGMFAKAVGNYEAIQEKRTQVIDLREAGDVLRPGEKFASLQDKQIHLRRTAFQEYLVNMRPYLETKVDHHAQAKLTAPEVLLYHETFDDDKWKKKKKTKVFDPDTVPGIMILEHKFNPMSKKELWTWMIARYGIEEDSLFTAPFRRLYPTASDLPLFLDSTHYLCQGLAKIKRTPETKTVEVVTNQGTFVQEVHWVAEKLEVPE